jgi:hypothetical protein
MNAWKIAATVAFAFLLHGASAMAASRGHEASRTRGAATSHRAVSAKHVPGAKAHKTPAIKRTPSRDSSSDLELPQLG